MVLNLTVKEGAAAHGNFSITFTRGLAGEISNLIDDFLSNTGTIAKREERINSDLSAIETDREELETRMTAYQARLTAQFQAMERIVSSFQSTGNQLDGLNDRLPFTAKTS